MNPALNEGLPPFLAEHAGLESGFMMVQVTAAALVAENRVLAHPASPGSITTSGNKEDFVSMGMTSALKLQQMVENSAEVLAIEMMTAVQAMEYAAAVEIERAAGGDTGRVAALSPARTEDSLSRRPSRRWPSWLKEWRTQRSAWCV